MSSRNGHEAHSRMRKEQQLAAHTLVASTVSVKGHLKSFVSSHSNSVTLPCSSCVPEIGSFENMSPQLVDAIFSACRDLPQQGLFVTHNIHDPEFREAAFNTSALNPHCASLRGDNAQMENGHPAGAVSVWSGGSDNMAPEAVLDLVLCPTWFPSGVDANQQVHFT